MARTPCAARDAAAVKNSRRRAAWPASACDELCYSSRRDVHFGTPVILTRRAACRSARRTAGGRVAGGLAISRSAPTAAARPHSASYSASSDCARRTARSGRGRAAVLAELRLVGCFRATRNLREVGNVLLDEDRAAPPTRLMWPEDVGLSSTHPFRGLRWRPKKQGRAGQVRAVRVTRRASRLVRVVPTLQRPNLATLGLGDEAKPSTCPVVKERFAYARPPRATIQREYAPPHYPHISKVILA